MFLRFAKTRLRASVVQKILGVIGPFYKEKEFGKKGTGGKEGRGGLRQLTRDSRDEREKGRGKEKQGKLTSIFFTYRTLVPADTFLHKWAWQQSSPKP
jgi:hypothetical protein